MISLPPPSPLLYAGFLLLPLAMATVVVAAIERTSTRGRARKAGLFLGLWMTVTAVLAMTGWLSHFDPPRVPLVMAGIVAILVWTARAAWARDLATIPIQLLVGFQAFRIVVELLIHEAAAQRIAPHALSWEGYNLDIVTGLTAALLAPFAGMAPRWLLHVWNAGGAAILAVVIGTAFLTMPGPTLRIVEDPPNVWITTFPFVWLPAVLVLVAFGGHIVLARKLLQDARTEGPAG